MIRENRQVGTDEPVEFENNRLKFTAAGKLPIILEKSMEHTPNFEGKPVDVNT